MIDLIQQWIDSGKPLMGICLGLQILFSGSEESDGVEGLSIFDGTVKKFELSSEKGAADWLESYAELRTLNVPCLKALRIIHIFISFIHIM